MSGQNTITLLGKSIRSPSSLLGSAVFLELALQRPKSDVEKARRLSPAALRLLQGGEYRVFLDLRHRARMISGGPGDVGGTGRAEELGPEVADVDRRPAAEDDE